MPAILPLRPEPPAERDELRRQLERASQGDEASLPELRRILDRSPGLWRYYGDLAAHTVAAWIDLVAGDDLLLRESVALKARKMKAQLLGPDPTPLESLLADRVVACWLQLTHADAAAAKALSDGAPPRVCEFWAKRQGGAHHRYITSLGALATARRLLPGESQKGRATEARAEQIGVETSGIPVLQVRRSGPGDA
jgi:hypothetical protein